jgi:predicted 3-demethylubiquinone-9 3-methyltransferase (glyoxalase superfamily)
MTADVEYNSPMQKITTFLSFDSQAEEAVRFYTSIFKNSKIGHIARYGPAASEAAGRPEGSVMIVEFELEGQPFIALNGGPPFKFSPAISLFVKVENQQELDELWAKLTDGGEEVQCGWLTDKYGLSWQIVPAVLDEMLYDPVRSENVMKAVMEMKKLDVATLKQAYEQD